MIKIAVCEDSINDLSAIEKILDEITSIKIDIDVFTNGKDLLYTIALEGNYDIYLLDIHLPDLSGIEIAREIRQYDLNSILIFITALPTYALEAYEYITFAYLLKPLSKCKLESILLRAETYLQKNHRIFQYAFNKISYIIPCDNIYYFCKSGRKVYIYTKSGIKECNMRVNDILDKLNKNRFAQINRTYIINFQYIEVIQKNSLYIAGNKISIGNTHREEFLSRYLSYINAIK